MFVYGRSDGHSKLICGQLIPYLLKYYCPKLRTFQNDKSDIETRNKDRFETECSDKIVRKDGANTGALQGDFSHVMFGTYE